MTHDELLAKIQWTWNHNLEGAFVNAIEAIAELHKPDELLNECNACSHIVYRKVVRIKYPCETIKAIEKELS